MLRRYAVIVPLWFWRRTTSMVAIYRHLPWSAVLCGRGVAVSNNWLLILVSTWQAPSSRVSCLRGARYSPLLQGCQLASGWQSG